MKRIVIPLVDKWSTANIFIYCFLGDLRSCLLEASPAHEGIIKNVSFATVCHPSRAQQRKKAAWKNLRRKWTCLCCIVIFIYRLSIKKEKKTNAGQTQKRHYFENTLQLGLCNFTVERAPQIQFCGLEVAPEVCEWIFQTFGECVPLKIQVSSNTFY